MQTLEFLRKVRETIATPDRWCKGFLALDANHDYTTPRANDACRFCLLGAIQLVEGPISDTPECHDRRAVANHARVLIHRKLQQRYSDSYQYWENVAEFNDNHSHAEVLAMIDETIADHEANPGPRP